MNTEQLSPPSLLNRIDPTMRREEWLSRVMRPLRRWGDKVAMLLFVGVATALLAGNATPVYGLGTGAAVTKFVTFGKLGLLTKGTAVMMSGATQQPTKYPFRYGTVLRRVTINQNVGWNYGQGIPSIVIPQVGMLARVFVDLEGTYTKANVSGLATLDGFDAIVQRAQVTLNNGSANLVDLSGVGINVINKSMSLGLPIKRGLSTTAGARFFSLRFILPVNANNRRQFEMGLVNLQAPELRANINLTFAPLANVFATPADVTAIVNTATVSYQYWEIPDPNTFVLPPLTIVRCIEESPIAIAATGDQTYQIPRLGTMIDYHAVLVLNSLYGTVLNSTTNVSQFSEFKWRYNKTDTVFDVFIPDWETIETEIVDDPNTTFLIPQAITLFLWNAGDRNRNGGDFRDAIDTEENTTTESIPTVTAGTVLTPGKDFIFHVRRVVQRVVQATAPTSPSNRVA